MAESGVDFLLQTLGSALQQEVSLLQELSSIDEIQQELQSMRSFLKDADRRKNSDDGVKIWVGQVSQVAFEIEDIIDEYMYLSRACIDEANEDGGGGLLWRSLYKMIHLLKRYYYKRQIASKLQAVRCKISQVSERSKRYNFQIEHGSTSKTTKNESGENWQRSGEYLSSIPDDHLVGIEKNKDFLIRKLTDHEPERVVLSVVGMGGLGKTTLVIKTYNSPKVKKHFHCHAWITVSQSYILDEVLRSLIKELYESSNEPVPDATLSNMNTGRLVQMVTDYLLKKRYVIVLDDVWESNFWKDIHVAFPNNGCGGRVLITTRKDDVSSSFRDENVLRLEPLGYGDAFVLFCNNAFHNKSCPPELKPFAESLVQKCEGLPLAIIAIGGLMLGKGDSCLEWKKVEQSLSSQLSSNSEFAPVKNILLLSYDDLPYYLQRCFLYCTLFPEDYSIPQKRLIRLWVAEGLVEEHRGLTLEEVAAGYIKELTCRSLLQVEADHIYKPRKCVRMHDVFRELALEIAREEKFCDALVATEEIQNNEARRLSLSNFIGSIQSSSCHLRSLMFFSTEIPSLSLNSIASSIKLLRVLDVEGSSIGSVPDELIELFNLRYLSLKKTNVDKLPESIGRFQNLQTLDIRDSKIKTLPKGVVKLRKLRHLYTYRRNGSTGFDFYDFAQAPNGICDLNCLQSLVCIGANDEVIRKVGNLTQLRDLTIRDVQSSHGEELCVSLGKLKCLLMLQVKATGGEEMLRLDTLHFHPPTYLEVLDLSGRLEMLPPGIRSVQSLTDVTLHWSQLNEDPLTLLQELPNLLRRTLTNAYVGKELCIRRGRFLKLKLLTFDELPRLDRILIEEESLSCLRNIDLFDCPELKNIPEGIQYLTSLQRLSLQDMSGELLEMIRQDRGVNLQRIPKIIHYISTSGSYQSF